MSDKLNINNEMRQFDLKNRGFYDELTDEERKKFSNFLMLRWGSAVNHSNRDLQEYYVISTNQNMNRNFFDIGKHPKLQWLLATCVSPNMGAHKHEWIAFKGKASKNKRANFLGTLYPTMKMSDLELMADEMTDDDVKLLLRDLGWEDKKIKEALK
jgi:hypothetical protein